MVGRCRRAWDLGSATRADLEPVAPAGPPVEAAIREALAVYYYPAMWDWPPAVVRPLVLTGFRDALARAAGVGPGPRWDEAAALGEAVLGHYFEWAPLVDRFAPVLVGTEYLADVPDPADPAASLAAGGRAVRYRGRIDAFVVDEANRYWLLRHRLVDGAWPDPAVLALDDAAVAECWAWERFALASVAGVLVNELLAAVPAPAERTASRLSERRRRDLDRKRGTVAQHRHRARPAAARPPVPEEWATSTGFFRRTEVPLSRARVDDVARRIAADAAAMTAAGPDPDPRPVPDNCGRCPYRAPCLAMSEGADAAPLLAAGFRRRPRRDDVVRIGGLFGLNPNQVRVADHQPRRAPS
ncbi:MAG TPA: hypothetical protein VGB14_03365 [Acidimicrobiales bacterium]